MPIHLDKETMAIVQRLKDAKGFTLFGDLELAIFECKDAIKDLRKLRKQRRPKHGKQIQKEGTGKKVSRKKARA